MWWICNNLVIENCPQSVPVKIFLNRSIVGEDMDKSKVLHFYGPRCISDLRYFLVKTTKAKSRQCKRYVALCIHYTL